MTHDPDSPSTSADHDAVRVAAQRRSSELLDHAYRLEVLAYKHFGHWETDGRDFLLKVAAELRQLAGDKVA